jgi:hypothetical protein
MTDDVVPNYDEHAAFFGDYDHDPYPDDAVYQGFLLARAELERKARRLFRCRKVRPFQAARRRPRSNRSVAFHRWLTHGMRHRAPRRSRVARHASSGVGSEAGDGDPEPPWRPWQRGSVFGHKKYKEHRTAHSMSGCQEGGHHG